jgi:hypothetical protein
MCTTYESTTITSSDNPSCVKRTVVLRLFFLLSLGAAAAVCVAVAYTVTIRLEEEIAINTYESVAASALEESQAITKRKLYGADVLSSMVGFSFPEARPSLYWVRTQ